MLITVKIINNLFYINNVLIKNIYKVTKIEQIFSRSFVNFDPGKNIRKITFKPCSIYFLQRYFFPSYYSFNPSSSYLYWKYILFY